MPKINNKNVKVLLNVLQNLKIPKQKNPKRKNRLMAKMKQKRRTMM